MAANLDFNAVRNARRIRAGLWATEPKMGAIKTICRRHLDGGGVGSCVVSVMKEDTTEVVYLVESGPQKRHVLRVRNTDYGSAESEIANEAAALRWVRHHTDMPVARVIALDATSQNEVGHPWLLMDFLTGTKLYYRWRKMPMAAKRSLVERLASYQAQLFGPLRGIGAIQDGPMGDSEPPPNRGPLPWYEWESWRDLNFSPNYSREAIPYRRLRCSYDWLKFYIDDVIEPLSRQADGRDGGDGLQEGDRDIAAYQVLLLKKLAAFLPKLFPPTRGPPERSVLCHRGLSLGNILVDDEGNITGILGGHKILKLPLWLGTRHPPEIEEGWARHRRHLDKEPNRDDYADAGADEVSPDAARYFDLDNEGKGINYWRDRTAYESTQLRKAYTDRMRQLRPTWDVEVADSELKQDFLQAVDELGNLASFPMPSLWLEEWIHAVACGDSLGLGNEQPSGLEESATEG